MKLRSKLLILFLIFALGTLLVVSVQTYILTRNEIISNRIEQLSVIAEKQKQKINIYLQNVLERSTSFSTRYELRLALRDYLNAPNPSTKATLTRLIADEKRIDEGTILDMYLVGKDGIVIDSTNIDKVQSLVNCGASERLCIRSDGLMTVDMVYFEGQSLATLYILYPTEEIDMVALDYEGLGRTGETTIARYDNQDGKIVRFIAPVRSDPNAAFTRTVNGSQTTVPIVAALRQQETSWVSTRDYRNVPVLAVSKYIDLASWGLTVEIDASEALASLWNLQIGLIITAGVASGFVFVLSLYLSKFITDPIKNLTVAARSIASGDLSKRVLISGNDEITELSIAFNLMQEKLHGYQENLAKQVLERTGQLETAKKELEEKIRIVEQQNEKAQETKLAMTNLLEDARALEQDLKRERDTATAILASMNEGLCVIDKNAKIIVMNTVAMGLLSITQDEAINATYPDLIQLYKSGQQITGDDRPVIKTLRTGVSLSGGLEDNYQYKTASGKLLPVAWSTVALKRNDEITGEVITFHDISRDLTVKETIENQVKERTRELMEKNSDLEKAQKQVSEGWLQQQREKARLTASINSLSLGFILTDMEHRIITLNPAAQGILGLSARPEHLADIEKLLQGVCDLHALHEECHKEQKPIHVASVLFGKKFLRLFLAPIVLFTTREEHIGTVILVEDITESKNLERSRDEFFSIASHELRTPLTAIRGNTSLIIEHYLDKLDPDMKELVGDIHESSVRLIDIVNDFLNMSRLEQQRLEFKNEPFDISELIGHALKEYQVTGSRQKIALEYEAPPAPLPSVFSDKDRTRQVIINLVGNALKFTESGSVKIKATANGNMVEVAVSDTGKGISEANQSLLFHKFQQASDNILTRDMTRGTGLGLYISRLIIEGMGGKIWLASSEPGKGSTFTFSLPVAH